MVLERSRATARTQRSRGNATPTSLPACRWVATAVRLDRGDEATCTAKHVDRLVVEFSGQTDVTRLAALAANDRFIGAQAQLPKFFRRQVSARMRKLLLRPRFECAELEAIDARPHATV